MRATIIPIWNIQGKMVVPDRVMIMLICLNNFQEKLARSLTKLLLKNLFLQLKQKLKMKKIAIKKTTVGVQQNCIFGNFFLLFLCQDEDGEREWGKVDEKQHFMREVLFLLKIEFTSTAYSTTYDYFFKVFFYVISKIEFHIII